MPRGSLNTGTAQCARRPHARAVCCRTLSLQHRRILRFCSFSKSSIVYFYERPTTTTLLWDNSPPFMCPRTARAPNHVPRWKGPNPPRAGPAHPAGFVSVHLLEGPVTCIGPAILHAAGLADARGIGSSTIIRSRRNSKRIGPRILVNKSDSLSSVLTFTSLHNPLSRSACTQSCRQSMCRIFERLVLFLEKAIAVVLSMLITIGLMVPKPISSSM